MRNTLSSVQGALEVIIALGLPPAQHNERSALCLLALLDLPPGKPWADASHPLLGITPMMNWMALHYDKIYAPNTRETIRRQSIHQFLAAGLIRYNPDKPDRAVNSPKAVYQIEPKTLGLIKTFGTRKWDEQLTIYLENHGTLVEHYANERLQHRVPVKISDKKKVVLSPGAHSELLGAIVEDFAPRFAPGGTLLYLGDIESKWGHFDEERLSALNVKIDAYGKMPDAIVHFTKKNWLLLIEAVTSHGPVDGKRHAELKALFKESTAGLVFVTAFPDRSIMGRYIANIAWETEVWVANAPSHLIHFNGVRFLGPYEEGPSEHND